MINWALNDSSLVDNNTLSDTKKTRNLLSWCYHNLYFIDDVVMRREVNDLEPDVTGFLTGLILGRTRTSSSSSSTPVEGDLRISGDGPADDVEAEPEARRSAPVSRSGRWPRPAPTTDLRSDTIFLFIVS